MDVDPQMYVVIAALTVAGWLAGRNRLLARQMRTMVVVYEDLVAALRKEIDRLRRTNDALETEVTQLRPLKKRTTRSRQGS